MTAQPRDRSSRIRRLRPLIPAAGLVAVAALAPFPASAQEAPDKTRVYVVVVDGLNIEEVALMPFLSSLTQDGTYYPESRSVMVAETLPNHVSMVTGNYPDRTGIVGNNFPDPETGEVESSSLPEQLESDTLFTLIDEQCPDLTTASVTSKDDLFTIFDGDRNDDGQTDVDFNFANLDDPTFIPGLGLTPDVRTAEEARRVSSELDPDFMFVNLGLVDRFGHIDAIGGATTPALTGSRPVARDVQRTETDLELRQIVDQLKAEGKWDSTAFIVTADHSMDWSLPTSTVSLFPQFEDDPLLAGKVFVAQNGGAALYSLLDRADPQADELLARMREIAVTTEGVDEALFREPNPLAGGEEFFVGRVHPDWHQTHPRSGDLLVTVNDGLRLTEPGPFSNPIPGNHGMASTLRVPTLVAGGLDVLQDVVEPTTDDPFVRSPDQAENVDIATTAAWLLGVDPPEGGFDGRALEEAFGSQPEPSCNPAVAAPPPGPQVPAPPSPSPSPDSQQNCDDVPEATAYRDRDDAREVHKRSIDCVIAREIARGSVQNGEQVYRPLEDVTRAQMATFIVNTLRAAGTDLPEPDRDAFDDIAESFHREPIEVLAAAGIVEGKSGGTSYAPQETVSRQQMASFMVRAAQFAVEPNLVEQGERRFTDVPDGGIHSEAIAIGDDNALFRGTTATTFSPTVVVMRDQMASFLVNLLAVASDGGSA